MTSVASQPQLIRRTFPVGPLQCNCTIIGDPVSKKAIVVDPGGDAKKILAVIEELGLKVVSIIHTHAHLDHILAAGEIKKATGASLCLHKEDLFLWEALEEQCRVFGVPYQAIPGPDEWLKDEADLGCADGVAIHTPGHTPGSMSFWFEDYKLLIAGDTLFKRSIGRTDLWGGDMGTLLKSIKQRLMTLDEEATVVTGHGPETSIGEERRSNPFINRR
jgi:glyoxylase-like metal-dependent hydrolase (beta-lactamase superfamily II)